MTTPVKTPPPPQAPKKAPADTDYYGRLKRALDLHKKNVPKTPK